MNVVTHMSNELGLRGEALFSTLITKFYGRSKPIFRPQFLGDKWPTVDFIVELLDAGAIIPYFFAQVRSTRNGYTRQGNRLKVQVQKESMSKLALYPAPTYIIGIDDVREEGYIVSANGEWIGGLSSLPTNFPINKDNQDLLWKEVEKFWSKVGIRQMASKFIDPL